MEMNRTRQAAIALILIVIALISFFVLSDFMSRPDTFSNTINCLDEKKTTVAEMTAAATAASAAITLLPNDVGTPIADKLVDLSGYFILIFSAIYLEKFLTIVSGYIVFRYLIPIAFLLLAVNVFLGLDSLRRFAVRAIVFGVLISLLIPASVAVSNLIEETHEYSLQQTIDNANEAAEEITINSDTEDNSVLDQFLEKVKGGVDGQIKKFENILSDFIDSIAVLIVTTCVIPILVLVILVALMKQIFGIEGSAWINMDKAKDKKNSLTVRK